MFEKVDLKKTNKATSVQKCHEMYLLCSVGLLSVNILPRPSDIVNSLPSEIELRAKKNDIDNVDGQTSFSSPFRYAYRFFFAHFSHIPPQ